MSYGQADYGPSRRPNWKLRLAIAGMIALVSIISFYSMTTENPVTGEHQRVGMSPDQEIALGLQAAPEMEVQHGGLAPTPGHGKKSIAWASGCWLRSTNRPAAKDA